jgi:DNA-binding PadR family transcriptional regulator
MTEPIYESDLSLAIMGLLSIQPLSGYGLRKIFLTTAIKAYSASPGAIYPALQRLEATGLIAGKAEKRNTRRPSVVYRLTAKGRAALVEILGRPVVRDDVMRRMDKLLLRFSFMSGFVGTSMMIEFLRALAEETERYRVVLEEEFAGSASDLPFSGRAALALGVESSRTVARWARRTLGELERAQKK